MERDVFEYWLQKVKHLTREQMERNLILPTDSYEECEEKIGNVSVWFSSQSHDTWDYFQGIYFDIPVQHRLRLMLEWVYQDTDVNYTEFYQYISEYLEYDETEEMKEIRIRNNKKLLKNHLSEDGTVKVYRGCAEYFVMPEYAVSYSLSEKVAKFFVEHHKIKHGSRFGAVAEKYVNIEDVLFYSNEREEQEIFIIPEAIRKGKKVESWTDIERLDADRMYRDFENAEDIVIVDALEQEQKIAG